MISSSFINATNIDRLPAILKLTLYHWLCAGWHAVTTVAASTVVVDQWFRVHWHPVRRILVSSHIHDRNKITLRVVSPFCLRASWAGPLREQRGPGEKLSHAKFHSRRGQLINGVGSTCLHTSKSLSTLTMKVLRTDYSTQVFTHWVQTMQ